MSDDLGQRAQAAVARDSDQDRLALEVEGWARADCWWSDDDYWLDRDGVRSLVERAWAAAEPGWTWQEGQPARGFTMLVHFDIAATMQCVAMAGPDGLHFEPDGADSFTVLHEVAHLLTGGGGHHAGWRAEYRQLVETLIGPDEGRVFATYFSEHLGDVSE